MREARAFHQPTFCSRPGPRNLKARAGQQGMREGAWEQKGSGPPGEIIAEIMLDLSALCKYLHSMQIVPPGNARIALRPLPSRAAHSRSWRDPRAARAFTLVEVAFAIGVVAFAFLPILGLIPTGMSVFQQANNTSLTAQIVQRVANDVKQTNFDTLIGNGTAAMAPGGVPIAQGGTLEPRYFDVQCNEIIPANPWQPTRGGTGSCDLLCQCAGQ